MKREVNCLHFQGNPDVAAQKEITSQTDKHLVSLSFKKYVFEDKLTVWLKGHLKYRSVPLLMKENKQMNASPKFALSNSN